MNAFRRIARYVYPYKKYIGLNIFFNLLATLFSLASIGLVIPVLRIIFDRTVVQDSPPELVNGDFLGYAESFLMYEIGTRMAHTGQEQALLYVCYWVVGAFFLKNLFRYASTFVIAPLRNGVTRDLRNEMHSKVLALPLGYFSEKRKGDVISRMTADLKEIENSILATVESIFREPVMILASLAVLLAMNYRLTLFVLVLLPVVSILITRIGKSLKRASTRAQGMAGQILSQIEEDIGGLRVIKAFNAEDQKRAGYHQKTHAYYQFMNRVLRRHDLASPVSEFLGAVVMAVVIWYGGTLVLDLPSFTAEKFIAYVLFFYQLIPPAKNLSKVNHKIQRGNASSERVLEILDAHNPISDAPDAMRKPSFEESLQFDQVSFGYDPHAYVLKDVSLRVAKGRTVALVGESGGGKSTLTNLVPRFYEADHGTVRLDGTDLRKIKLQDLRQLLGIVTQDTILFNATVAENIALGQPDASLEQIQNAARIANAHRFIAELEEGYHTNIGDGGNKLSGGQRQRLSIARAVLKNPPILILDEATSALDTESEKLVQEALFKLMENRTSLVIAHRLSTIQHADEIIVMRQGQIAERGTHSQLLEKKGIYAKLVEMQSFA
ncbi:MAG: ABC transporter ATP-binding protein [Schleiferiaceae bacterium]|nr:ABC transporter ATP-binding protein [Schleiferiaceae bacterium]MDR9441899.1 ABC transporter ATP-binding protein [Schleiferiaceae bacterium]